MSSTIEFFYDIASPYSYLAAHRIYKLSASTPIEWCPVLVGGIFKATGNTMPAAVPARASYIRKDLLRWANRHNTPFVFSSSFPHHSLLAMRALTALSHQERIDFSMALFKAAWVDNRDIAKADVLAEIFGQRASQILNETQNPDVKNALKAMTQKAIDHGAFGAPSFLINHQLYWGNDRLEMALECASSGL